MTDQIQALERELVAAREQADVNERVTGQRESLARDRLSILSRIQRLRTMDPDAQLVLRCPLEARDLPSDALGIVGPRIRDLVIAAEGDLAAVDAQLLELDKAA